MRAQNQKLSGIRPAAAKCLNQSRTGFLKRLVELKERNESLLARVFTIENEPLCLLLTSMMHRKCAKNITTFSLFREINPEELQKPDAPFNLEELFLMKEKSSHYTKDYISIFEAEKKLLKHLRVENFSSCLTFAPDMLSQPLAIFALFDAISKGKLFFRQKVTSVFPASRFFPEWLFAGGIDTLGAFIVSYFEKHILTLFFSDRHFRRIKEKEATALLVKRYMRFWLGASPTLKDELISTSLDRLLQLLFSGEEISESEKRLKLLQILNPPSDSLEETRTEMLKNISVARHDDERAFILSCFYTSFRICYKAESVFHFLLTRCLTELADAQSLETMNKEACRPVAIRRCVTVNCKKETTQPCSLSVFEEKKGSTPSTDKSVSPPPSDTKSFHSRATQGLSLEWDLEENELDEPQPQRPVNPKLLLRRPSNPTKSAKEERKRPSQRTEKRNTICVPVQVWGEEEEVITLENEQTPGKPSYLSRSDDDNFPSMKDYYSPGKLVVEEMVREKAYEELDCQIGTITAGLTAHSERMAKARELVKQRVYYVIKRTIQSGFRLHEYGSYVTKLLTPFSDMDLAIDCGCLIDRPKAAELLQLLAENLSMCEFVGEVRPILFASVPVVKLQADPSVLFEGLECLNRSMQIKVDIIVQIKELFENSHTSTRTTAYVLSACRAFPTFRPNVLALKYALHCRGMMNAYTGGLNSYGLSLLYVAFLHTHKLENATSAGYCLMKFFEFVCREFDPSAHAICLNSFSGRNDCVIPKGFSGTDAPLVVLDPTHLVFSNVTATCFVFQNVRDLFREFLGNTETTINLIVERFVQSGDDGANQCEQKVRNAFKEEMGKNGAFLFEPPLCAHE